MQTIDMTTTTTLVPPARLGDLLRAARDVRGDSLHELEAQAQGRFSVGDLQLLESGRVAISDNDIEAVARLYGIDIATLTRGRTQLVIDRSEGKLLIGAEAKQFMPGDDDRQIMLRYLSLVYRLRDTKPGTVLPSRTGDLEVLSTVFGSSPEQVRLALEGLMLNNARDIRERHSLLRSKLIVPTLGVLVALTGVGGLLLQTLPLANDGAPTSTSTTTVAAAGPAINIGSALVITR